MDTWNEEQVQRVKRSRQGIRTKARNKGHGSRRCNDGIDNRSI